METENIRPCNCLECPEQCEFFKRLKEEELARLNSAKKAIQYNKGEVIIKKGGFHPYILLVSKGYVKVVIEADHNKSFIMEILSPHNMIMGNVFEDYMSPFTITAITDCTIIYLGAQIFTELLEGNGLFSTDVLKYTTNHAATRFHRLHSVTLKQSRGKLADVILYLNNMPQSSTIINHLSRQDLADMANISMENAIRTLKEFTDEGLVLTDKKDIKVLNLEGLKKVSKNG